MVGTRAMTPSKRSPGTQHLRGNHHNHSNCLAKFFRLGFHSNRRLSSSLVEKRLIFPFPQSVI
jgi:hypothetical protein